MKSAVIEDEFNQAVKSMGLGARLDLANNKLDSELNNLLLIHKERADHLIASMSKSQQIHFDFIDDPNLNAIAFTEEHNFVGLNLGTILIIYDHFFKLLADPNLFPEVGYGFVEKNILPDSSGPFSKKPVDPYRHALAVHFAWQVIDFIIVHEVTHLRNGHVGLLKELTARSSLLEITRITDSELALTRQTLEMDADAIAVCYGVDNLLWLTKEINRVPNNLLHVYQNIERALYIRIYGTISLFCLFDEQYWKLDKIGNGIHPPATWRQTAALSTAEEMLKKRGHTEIGSQMVKLGTTVTLDAINAWSSATGRTPIKENYTNLVHPTVLEHTARLLAHWKVLRPRLELHKWAEAKLVN